MKERNWVVNGEIVDKTRSLLTGTESKAEERQRAVREEIERDIGQNSEKDGGTKGERDEGKKNTHAPPAELNETHACDPILIAYCVSMPIRLSSRTPVPLVLPHLLDLSFSTFSSLNFVSISSFTLFCSFFLLVSIYFSWSSFFKIFIKFQELEQKNCRNSRRHKLTHKD